MSQDDNPSINAILHNMADAVVLFALEGHLIRYVNPAWEKLTGLVSHEAMGQPAFSLEGNLTPPHILGTLWDTVLAGKVWSGRMRGKRVDGTLYEVDATVAPVRGENEQIHSFIGMLHDVTETRKLEAHKASFLADAAHDLRSPMSSLKLRLYLLKKTPERYQEHLQAIEYLVEQIDAMVSDLVLLSRAGPEHPIGELNYVDLGEVIKRVTWAYWPLAQDKKLTLTFDKPDKPLLILADSEQIEHVVVNLVCNALNYTPSSGKIQVTVTQSEQQVVFTVQDSGIGISSEELPYIFERFYRANEAKCLSEGTGMGLAIAKGIVEQHGGRIEAESAAGQGSLFRVFLPSAS